jgi:hypothetical protein
MNRGTGWIAMRSTRLLNSMLAVALLASGGSLFAQQHYGPTPYADRGVERNLEQRGYQDGMFGADRDFQNHRRPDVNNRDEYRNGGRLPVWAQNEYREGFRRGYYQRVRQIYGGGRDRDHDGDRD